MIFDIQKHDARQNKISKQLTILFFLTSTSSLPRLRNSLPSLLRQTSGWAYTSSPVGLTGLPLTKGLNPFIIPLLYYALYISLVRWIRNNVYRTIIRHYPVVLDVSSNPGKSWKFRGMPYVHSSPWKDDQYETIQAHVPALCFGLDEHNSFLH